MLCHAVATLSLTLRRCATWRTKTVQYPRYTGIVDDYVADTMSAFNNVFDDSIVHYVNSMVGRSALFDRAMLFVSGNALTQGALFVSFFWYYWFKRTNTADIKRTREHLLATTAGGVVAIVLARCLALTLPFRMRPRFDTSVHFVLPEGVIAEPTGTGARFPAITL